MVSFLLHSFIHSSIHLSICPLAVYPTIYCSSCLFIHLFIHLFVHSLIQLYSPFDNIYLTIRPHVLKITYSRRKFYIELRPEPVSAHAIFNSLLPAFQLKGFETEERVVGFHMDNHEASKRLWVACIEHHAFFRMTEVSKSSQRGSPFRRSRLKITYVFISDVILRVLLSLSLSI